MDTIIRNSNIGYLLSSEAIDEIIDDVNFGRSVFEIKQHIISLIGDYSGYVDYEAEELAQKLKGI